MLPGKRGTESKDEQKDSNCPTNKETARFQWFPSRSDLRFLTIVFSIQILANLIVLVLFWENGPKESLKKLNHINAEILDQYAAEQISRNVSVGTMVIPYRFLTPKNLISGHKYPLVVFLHGAGSRGNDNSQQLKPLPSQLLMPPWRKKYACYVLAPQCPSELWWGMEQVTDLVAELIQETVRSNSQIDPKRVYLIGLSMGGNGCWSLAARHPDIFAGVAPFCGQGNPDNASKMEELPFWVVHGDADRVINVLYSRKMVDALKKLNATVVYHELKGVGHNCWQESFQDPSPMMDWMFQQNRRLNR